MVKNNGEGNIIRTLQDNIAAIGHFHTANNPGRNDQDETQELPCPAICCAIAAVDCAGYVGQEFTPTGDACAAREQTDKVCDV